MSVRVLRWRKSWLVLVGLPCLTLLPPEQLLADEAKSGGAAETVAPGGEASTPAEAASPLPTVVQGVAWDMIAGGIPERGSFLMLELGFSSLPRISFHRAVKEGLSIGGSAALDYAYFTPSDAFHLNLVLGMPIRYALFERPTISLAGTFEPGFLISLAAPHALGLCLSSGLSFGYAVDTRLVLGAGVQLPLVLAVPFQTRSAYVSLPILVGPSAEIHLTPSAALTFDAKFGPTITSDLGTRLGVRLLFGVVQRI